ncbi:hypothetical protein L2725_03020 [Shewanella corallii]|uniref:TPR repeat containing protein n=2 Tax=Shewanella TaxID=22 RepID=A0ABT0N2U5_9GAMM|nr:MULTISPECIES: hypothetical protein [Shewanella]MCL1036151.1 hypothetical protein [Shewanella submarina]MCL2912763.1 hypothetical protein [Shewanella corallii]
MLKVILTMVLAFWSMAGFAQTQGTQEEIIQANKEIMEKSLMERYVMDELKALRQNQLDLERRMIIEITDRELSVADKSLNYANVTVTYFFYIIAGVASMIAFIGWQSFREIKANTNRLAEEQLQAIAEQYEAKFKELERELKRKTRIITENNREIEIINEVHNLWLRAQGAVTPEQKIEIYDEILTIRPGDLEALTYKADAAMEIREFNWALSLCNRVLEVDNANSHALYQRACALASMGADSRAISDLSRAISLAPSFRELAQDEPDFDMLRGKPEFEQLLESITEE